MPRDEEFHLVDAVRRSLGCGLHAHCEYAPAMPSPCMACVMAADRRGAASWRAAESACAAVR